MEYRKSLAEWQERNISSVLYHASKQRAKKHNIEFNIEISDIVVPTHCPILKCEFDHARRKGRKWNGASIDRIDNNKGYVKGNVWIISDLANRMKQNATIEQLKLFAEWINTLE
jgi:hypothetical protein